jgi:hypothetical protein
MNPAPALIRLPDAIEIFFPTLNAFFIGRSSPIHLPIVQVV